MNKECLFRKLILLLSPVLVLSGFFILSGFSSKAEEKIVSIPTAGVTSYMNADQLSSSATAGVSSILFKNSLTISADESQKIMVSAPLSPDIPLCGTEYGYTHMGIAVDGGNVNVRESATVDSKRVGKLPDGGACEIVGEEGDWYEIISGDIEGYVSKEFLLTGHAAEAQAKSFLTSNEELKTSLNMLEARFGEGVTDVRAELTDKALSYAGLRYKWGGTSLTSGADCSGFVMGVFAQYGIYLPHYSGAQAQYGKSVSVSELKPGDLVFYGNKRISHVAIYIGNGCVVSALNTRKGVAVTGIYTPGRYKCSRSLLP